MPFRQRVARALGETVSNNSHDPYEMSSSPAKEESKPEMAKEQGSSLSRDENKTKNEEDDSTTLSLESPDQSKVAPSSVKEEPIKKPPSPALAPINASKVTKRASSAPDARNTRHKQQYYGTARVTRSSSGPLTNDDDEQLNPEKAYLSYYDILLTYEDVKALKADWLTDNNISFWEEWLEREILPKYPQARIVLLRPTMTFMLMKSRDPKDIRDALPNFSKVTHIFLPINDARNVMQAEGGSHWSLLLVSTLDGVAFHYDSMGGANFAEGRQAAMQLSRVLGTTLKFQAIEDCPQQENGNDCGVFVCILMRHLLVKRLLNANAREKVSMSMANKMIDSKGGRQEMMRIIESLRKEGERRRSASPFPHGREPPRIE